MLPFVVNIGKLMTIPLCLRMQPFLIWKQPMRVHKHKKAVQPQADSWRFIREGFYDDYTDNYNSKYPN